VQSLSPPGPGLIQSGPGLANKPDETESKLWKAAQDLEANFLAEMLKSAGFGAPRESFGGGAGEDQFASFLRQSQAEQMVKAGGIGLAESLFEALKERADGIV
jgi:peptidoglycan hydrolase FlgJ